MVVESRLIVHFYFTPPPQTLFFSLPHVASLSLALASVEALMVLPEELTSGYVKYL